MALILAKQEKYTEAKQYYYQALELQPNSADTHSNLAALLIILKDFQGAEAHYRKALDIDPNHSSTTHNLSLLFLTTGNWTEGWQYYESRYTAHMPNISTPI